MANGQGERREAAAAGGRLGCERYGGLLFAPPCGLGEVGLTSSGP
jgi:hypothetical protein